MKRMVSGSSSAACPSSSSQDGTDDDIAVSGNNINVAIRVRPPVQRELHGTTPYLNVVRFPKDHQSIILCEYLLDPQGQSPMPQANANLYSKQQFTFDYVYGPETSQEEVYTRSAQPAVLSVLDGYNATLLAYGQTGTGKTFTMEGGFGQTASPLQGSPSTGAAGGGVQFGIIPRAVRDIFDAVERAGRHAVADSGAGGPQMHLSVRASYLQIYNEVLYDLLKSPTQPVRPLIVRHTAQQGVYIEGLSEFEVHTPQEVYQLMAKGSALRATGATKMSELSSRSHAMFLVHVDCTLHTEDGGTVHRYGKLNIVDLAGSEKIHASGVTGQRLEETKNINRSLHELGNVISALASRWSSRHQLHGSESERRQHIPFRNSVLTSVLRDSLGGNCQTTLIACLSPSQDAYAESLSTLLFANRAKNIRNEAVINEAVDQDGVLRKYKKEVLMLRSQLQDVHQRLGDSLQGPSHEMLLEERRRAEVDRRAAVQALQESSRIHEQERESRRRLEQRLRELEMSLLSQTQGGDAVLSETGKLHENAGNEKADTRWNKAALTDKVAELENVVQQQRDAMLRLTERLQERDETIEHLEAEVLAYDRHIQQLEASSSKLVVSRGGVQPLPAAAAAATHEAQEGEMDCALRSILEETLPYLIHEAFAHLQSSAVVTSAGVGQNSSTLEGTLCTQLQEQFSLLGALQRDVSWLRQEGFSLGIGAPSSSAAFPNKEKSWLERLEAAEKKVRASLASLIEIQATGMHAQGFPFLMVARGGRTEELQAELLRKGNEVQDLRHRLVSFEKDREAIKTILSKRIQKKLSAIALSLYAAPPPDKDFPSSHPLWQAQRDVQSLEALVASSIAALDESTETGETER